MNITGILLAAGTSSRMGSINKLLLKYNNHTVIEEVLIQMLGSTLNDILIVTGFESALIEKLLADRSSDRVNTIHNSNYRHGRAESIKCAIRHIDSRTDAALFMVADKPGITSSLINRAIERYSKDQPLVLYVETPAGRGHPIIFSRKLFGELLQLKGDCIGNELIAGYKENTVKLIDDEQQIDIDTETDYRKLLKSKAGKNIS
jgi:molybdenum cofactor cytidylyltransferase